MEFDKVRAGHGWEIERSVPIVTQLLA
jgi:hypothetical protein